MSKTFEMTGIIHSKGDTTTFGNNGFTKREFVLKSTGPDENSSYPNYVALELIKDKCALLDQYNIGDELEVSFNISGRLWQGQGKPEKCFTSLQAWKISHAQQSNDQFNNDNQMDPSFDEQMDQSFDEQSFSNQPAGAQSAGNQSYGNQSYDSKASQNTPSSSKPINTPASDNIWEDDIPF
ncbi:DUF3127 domain-containing protein [Shewanella donghaensis]|uniref:DUF3127 domain-containing protein n=1 Tax=Shewanella donghaensis TaxID=238836 RepID=UPI001182373F|nr:DUF3127 domain-containing protein [Shewanella donghaensis]